MKRGKQNKLRGTGDAIPIPTTGKTFANGKVIESVRAGTHADRLSLLFWDGTKAFIDSKIICDGQSYEPAPIDPTILRALTLPTRIAPYGSPRKLLTDIAELISEYTGLPENSIAAISRWRWRTGAVTVTIVFMRSTLLKSKEQGYSTTA